MKANKKSKSPKKLKTLTDWDWTTLVASWRYYEHRTTISSSMFPGEIVQRFFSGAYKEEECRRIARQFVEVDHLREGESCWRDDKSLMNCDRVSWCKFYSFLKGYLDGFTIVVLDGEDKISGKHLHEEAKCFFCKYTERYYPVADYIGNPQCEKYCSPDFIKKITEPNQ